MNPFKPFQQSQAERSSTVELISQIATLAEVGLASVPGFGALRSLLPSEIATLQTVCGCYCHDWSMCRLLVETQTMDVDHSDQLRRFVSSTTFGGTVVLVMLPVREKDRNQGPPTEDWTQMRPGIHSNLMVCDSILFVQSCVVIGNSFISKTFIGPQAVVLSCGKISVNQESNSIQRNGLEVVVGPESGGGRTLLLAAESTMIDVCMQLQSGTHTQSSPTSSFSRFNIIAGSCVVRNTPTLENIYLSPTSSIIAACAVSNAILMPNASITNGSTVNDVLMQWNSAITENSNVSETLLMEQSHCGPNSFIASTVIGPDVHVSAGEIHATVLGPSTNAHHQSLLIGILWPLGRGNVGYGANVGSNHTGRLPDQETVAGEGTFFGLSNVVKFPVDLSNAPYSIVAAGVSLPPQRICMPFSLILNADGGKNDIIPGWVLQYSPYTISRSEKKFQQRRKAKRHDFYTGWKIIRPGTIEMCRWARHALQSVDAIENVPGIGVNTLSAKGKKIGISAYSDCIQRYALHGLLDWIDQCTPGIFSNTALQKEFQNVRSISPADPTQSVSWPLFPWNEVGSQWEYQKMILVEEFTTTMPGLTWCADMLHRLVELEQDYCKRIRTCKHRDDVRGKDTIPGYAESHVAAENDVVVIEAKESFDEVSRKVDRTLQTMFKQNSKL